jgi:hypothetical protein
VAVIVEGVTMETNEIVPMPMASTTWAVVATVTMEGPTETAVILEVETTEVCFSHRVRCNVFSKLLVINF